jgi:hypothetical protein
LWRTRGHPGELGFGKAPAPTAEKVQTLAELFRRAAEANLNYFESVVLNGMAESNGMHPDAVKVAFASKDFDPVRDLVAHGDAAPQGARRRRMLGR